MLNTMARPRAAESSAARIVPIPFVNVAKISSFGIITNQDAEILIGKDKRGFYAAPGGGVEFGENPWEALGREVLDEVGYNRIANLSPSIQSVCTQRGLGVVESPREGMEVELKLYYRINAEGKLRAMSEEMRELMFIAPEKALELDARRELRLRPSLRWVFQRLVDGRKPNLPRGWSLQPQGAPGNQRIAINQVALWRRLAALLIPPEVILQVGGAPPRSI